MLRVLTHEQLFEGCKSFTTDGLWKFEDSWHQPESFQFIVRKGGGQRLTKRTCQECKEFFAMNDLISRGKRAIGSISNPFYCRGTGILIFNVNSKISV